jgi:hypothetical protein
MNTLLLTVQLLPLLLECVRAVESAIPVPGQGKRKLDFVLDTLKAAYDGSVELRGRFTWEGLVAVVLPLITRIVNFHNELGLFQHQSGEPKNA